MNSHAILLVSHSPVAFHYIIDCETPKNHPSQHLAFTPDAKQVIAVSQSGIHVYSWPELDHKRAIRTSALNLHCLAFSPNEKYLAVGGGAPSEEGIVEVFSWPEGEPVTRFDSHKDSVRSVVWQDDVKLLSAKYRS